MAARVRVVARVLGHTALEDVCKDLLEMVDYAARVKYKKCIKCNYGQQDVLRTIGAHLLSLRKWAKELQDPISAKLEKWRQWQQPFRETVTCFDSLESTDFPNF